MTKQFDAWLERDAMPLPFDAPASALDSLAVDDAALVFLGELNHFVHEKSDFRTLFARRLIGRGFDALGEELGWSDGTRLARYFRERDERVFDRLSLFGFKGDQRQDRDDEPEVFARLAKAYPFDAMRSEHTRFYRTIAPRAYFGFDIDAMPHGYRADIAEFDARCAEQLAAVPHESMAEEIARLEAALAGCRDPLVRTLLEAAIDSFCYLRRLGRARDYASTRPAMRLREDAMKRRVAAARERVGGRLTLMSHATHLAKDDALIDAFVGVGPGGGLTCSLGHHLVQELGLKAFSIWMIYATGEDSQPLPDLPRQAAFASDSLNLLLAERLNEPALILTAHAPETPVTIAHMYNATFRTTLRGQVDALYFVPRVTPMQIGS